MTAVEHTGPAGMLCPACRVDLVMSERQGIEIDYCPKCRGVWLDRGELDKIIERSVGEAPRAAQPQTHVPPQPAPQSQPYQPQGHYKEGYGGHHYGGHGRRRKSWLEDLFD
ncbi:zf-TFIIB domain-containing protein [Brucella sp. IR073]|uniref:TFIIB-type zinc ribbon-containing protein n=1 Tax=unclassified Brucella TaxID=2632610 RepID=UPI003B981231